MTDKKFAALKKKVDGIVNKWIPILSLESHRLKFEYIRERHTESSVVALCSPLWQYKTHRVTFYMPSIAGCESDDELEEDVVHELVHILLAPTAGNDPSTDRHHSEKDEYATQCVAFALIAAYKIIPTKDVNNNGKS